MSATVDGLVRHALEGRTSVKIAVSPDVVAQRVDGEVVIVHLSTNEIYRLNPTASRLWDLMTGAHELGFARDVLLREFDVAPERLEANIEAIIAALASYRVISVEAA